MKWVLWTELAAGRGSVAVQFPPAQIKCFCAFPGHRGRSTDRIVAELIARFMAFRPEVGRELQMRIYVFSER